jgi:nuclease-like protein
MLIGLAAVAGSALAFWQRTPMATGLGVIGTVLLLGWIADREAGIAAVRWVRGARAERLVGEELNKLRGEGFIVMHDDWPAGGNIDHLVSGPTGVYLIETKLRRYTDQQLGEGETPGSQAAR